MTGFSIIEIVTIVATFFGCAFALIRTGTAPRQVWRTSAAAFGCGIISLGIGGTTQVFIQGLHGIAGGSKATRELAFNEILEHAYRPMLLGVVGLLFFWMALRSASAGDDEDAPNIGGGFATLMIAGATLSLVGIAAFHVGFIVGMAPESTSTLMLLTFYTSLFTVILCALSGFWSMMRGAAWAPEG